MPDNKSKEEKDEAAKRAAEQERLKKEQEKAKEQLDALLNLSRPKDLKEGVAGGVNNILGGAVGAAGIVVLAPTAGLVAGTKHGGIIGGAFGLTGGAVLGVVGGAAVAVMGAISGVGQVVRGVVAAPNAVIQPRKGKWWDEIDGKWVETNLSEEKENLSKVPDDDEDILGPARKEAEKEEEAHADKVEVVDVFYYEVLEVDPKAEQTKIKKQYYMLARRYHPDKVGKDDKEAAEKFKDIAEAYQVLSDPELRAKYDTEGRDALSADKTSAAASNIDATLLFAFLFGSDKFYDYVGRLGMATSASVGDSPKVGANDARTLQKRRCGRLALLLAQRLDTYVGGDIDGAKALWTSEGEELVKASYGYELLHLIGQVYSLCAVQFLGSLDSGIGMPSISKWAHSHSADWKRSRDTKKAQTQTMFAGLTAMQMQVKYQQATSEAKTEEERQKIDADFKKEMNATMIKIMWTTTVVDITNTLHETSQMVLFDTGVDKDARKTRGEALSALGDVLMGIPKPDGKEGEDDPSRLYEEAAMAAMLETVKRKEEATFGHS